MNFPDDDPLLGATDFVLNNPGNPDILTISDLSALAEQTVYRVFEGMGLVYNHRRYIHSLSMAPAQQGLRAPWQFHL
jgi:hypothetical protein